MGDRYLTLVLKGTRFETWMLAFTIPMSVFVLVSGNLTLAPVCPLETYNA